MFPAYGPLSINQQFFVVKVRARQPTISCPTMRSLLCLLFLLCCLPTLKIDILKCVVWKVRSYAKKSLCSDCAQCRWVYWQEINVRPQKQSSDKRCPFHHQPKATLEHSSDVTLYIIMLTRTYGSSCCDLKKWAFKNPNTHYDIFYYTNHGKIAPCMISLQIATPIQGLNYCAWYKLHYLNHF